VRVVAALAQESVRASSTYMRTVQRDINSHMRAILVDWLVEVAEEYHLLPETLYISVRAWRAAWRGPWGAGAARLPFKSTVSGRVAACHPSVLTSRVCCDPAGVVY
jgi:hypothetical protein